MLKKKQLKISYSDVDSSFLLQVTLINLTFVLRNFLRYKAKIYQIKFKISWRSFVSYKYNLYSSSVAQFFLSFSVHQQVQRSVWQRNGKANERNPVLASEIHFAQNYALLFIYYGLQKLLVARNLWFAGWLPEGDF